MSASLASRPPCVSEYPAKCFAVARIAVGSSRPAALVAAHHGAGRARRSGTGPRRTSRSIRPQRRSRAMHSTGENVQWMPVAATSSAVARATRSISSASHDAAMPSWVGKIVAPGQNECPWMQSSADEQRDPQPGLRGQVDWPPGCVPGEVCRMRADVTSAEHGRAGRRARRAGASARPSPPASCVRGGRGRARRSSATGSGTDGPPGRIRPPLRDRRWWTGGSWSCGVAFG